MPTLTKFNANKGFAGIYILVILLILGILGGIYYFKQTPNNIKTVSAKPLVLTPTPTPIVWKTYTNSKFNFKLTYPAKGMILGKDDYFEGECGNSIKEKTDALGTHIQIDNFFEIKIIKWQGNMESFLKSLGANNQYDVAPITDSGADEAIKVVGLKKGFEIAVGYPSLIYVTNIYKKGDNIFSIVGLENPNKGWKGCKPALVLDPVAHDHLIVKDWDISKSLKFN